MNNFLHCADNKDALRRYLMSYLEFVTAGIGYGNRVKLVWGKA